MNKLFYSLPALLLVVLMGAGCASATNPTNVELTVPEADYSACVTNDDCGTDEVCQFDEGLNAKACVSSTEVELTNPGSDYSPCTSDEACGAGESCVFVESLNANGCVAQ